MKSAVLFHALLAAACLAVGAARAQSPIDVRHYAAAIHFNIAQKTIAGDAVVTLRNAQSSPLSTVPLKLRDLTVARVEGSGGASLAFHQTGEDLAIDLPAPLAPGGETSLRILYGGSPTAEPPPSSWGGFFWGDSAGVTFTMGVSFGTPYVSMTRHWLPSNDIPSDKATFDLTYIVPNGYAAAGTGLLESIGAVGADSAAYRWVENHPTATYLVTLAVARYARVRSSWQGIPCDYFVLRKDSLKATTFFNTVAGMMECFTRAYGAYPFDKIGYCMTPIGAMEHQTMISYNQPFIEIYSAAEGVAAHELSHQWWGDCVTPADFREAWLSEGFATYSEALYSEYLHPGTGYLSSIKSAISNYLNSTARSEGVFPLYDFPRTPPSSNYPGTIYQKGAAVLGMLRRTAGDSAFFRALRAYGAAHAYGNGTSGDLRAAFEAESGSDLGWFFDEWVYKPGWPEYVLQSPNGGGSEPLRIRLLQTQDTAKVPLFRMPLDVDIVTTSDTLHFVVNSMSLPAQEFSFLSVPAGTVRRVTLDPKGIVLKKISYQTLAAPPLQGASLFRLDQNHPNPVSSDGSDPGRTRLAFSLSRAMAVRLDLYDSIGRNVKRILSGELESGAHAVDLSLRGFPPGAYFYLLQGGSETAVGKLILLP